MKMLKVSEKIHSLLKDFRMRTGITTQNTVEALLWKALKSCKEDQRQLNRVKRDIQDYLVAIRVCQVGNENKEVKK